MSTILNYGAQLTVLKVLKESRNSQSEKTKQIMSNEEHKNSIQVREYM